MDNRILNFTKNSIMNDYKEKILRICNENSKNTLMETLEIEYVDVGENFLVGKMPVTSKVYQPDGILHGGAMVALAESVGSAASYIFLNAQEFFVRGIEISANHVKSIKEGDVFAKATIMHKGRTTQVWDIKITDKDDNLLSLCKLTTLALPKK
ncbi:MAG: 1,4-dihydroxy-2-naphthoyl-CoA hydrolase [Psychroserpens sp.]|jgi:1,4-dihydroxy-2-naphthoyl-CoA hydrolase